MGNFGVVTDASCRPDIAVGAIETAIDLDACDVVIALAHGIDIGLKAAEPVLNAVLSRAAIFAKLERGLAMLDHIVHLPFRSTDGADRPFATFSKEIVLISPKVGEEKMPVFCYNGRVAAIADVHEICIPMSRVDSRYAQRPVLCAV